jgi:hypothetical protein
VEDGIGIACERDDEGVRPDEPAAVETKDATCL